MEFLSPLRRAPLATGAALILLAGHAFAASYYPLRLEDARATYVKPAADDSTAVLQKAIDHVQETTGQGIVFVEQGRYRISKTIYVWPGIRLIGYGSERPVFALPPNTLGFQSVPSYMIFFAGGRPDAPRMRGFVFQPPAPEDQPSLSPPGKIPDANPGTFYSAVSNINFEIGDGNPGAAAVRAHYAQHCYLAHIDFYIGSGWTGIHDGGNLAEDVHFHGGQFGIVTRKPSPGWQFTLLDATFDGQREAAIKEHEAGLTLIRPHFSNVPTAISIDPGYSDELWMKDGRLDNIRGPAVVISNEKNFRTEVNFENITCRSVPIFASFRESRKQIRAPGEIYNVRVFSHGLNFEDIGASSQIKTVFNAHQEQTESLPVPSDIPDLPDRQSWVNVQSLGAKGDGIADDTEVLLKAIDSHRTLYFPEGAYLVSDTLALKSDTVLIGLHPSATRIFLQDSTAGFQGIGGPKPVIEAPKGGTNIMTGIGVYTNGINPRAVAVKWMAGAHSLMNDVRFLGGHGTSKLSGAGEDIYNNTHTADPNAARRWDSQYPSLWITDGGGGTFMDIWTPPTFAQAGLSISDTSTEGRIYQLSSEHHVRNEVEIRNASNWSIYALQTEEERGEGGFALPLSIEHSSNLTIANFHLYRVVSSFQPFPHSVTISDSHNIRFRNFHCYSDSKVSFDNAVFDQTAHVEMRQREFAALTISGKMPDTSPRAPSPQRVEKLAGGFFNISGGAVDPAGHLYFIDPHWQRIYRWKEDTREAIVVRNAPLSPVQLAFDHAGDALVVSHEGKGVVYSFRPDEPGDQIKLLKAQAAEARPGLTPILPVDVWRNENDFPKAVTASKPYQFLSPDGTVFLPAGEDFITGQLYYGAKMQDIIRAFGLAPAKPGRPFYISDENQERTYRATISPAGDISALSLFVERGGEAVTADANGNVYLAAGQVYVYNQAGKQIAQIDVPERPTGLAFGGMDGKTLFILARTSLYATRALSR